MVADIKFKDVPRTLVRVPGSGRSQGVAAPAISCDLGRVSSLAASIPINPCLPAIMMGAKLLVASPTNNLAKNKLATSEIMIGMPNSPAGPSRRRPLNSEAEAEASQESKRPRLDVHTSSSATSHSVVQRNARSSQPVEVLAGTQSSGRQERFNLTATRRAATARTQPRPVPSSDYRSRSLEDLLEEQRILREENRMLQQQLAHYTRMRQERQRRMLGIVV